MLSPQAAALAIEVAKGLIKLNRRIDLILAEKEAAQQPIALPLPAVGTVPRVQQMRPALRQVLKSTADDRPDPIPDRTDVQAAIDDGDRQAQFEFVQIYAPGLLVDSVIDPDGAFVAALEEARPEWVADRDLLVTAFYVSAGPDQRNKSYTWRIALTVVDVLAEFGADNAALFTKDEGLQALIGSVLRRFGEADVQKTDSARELLHAALSATLNGALDARMRLGIRNDWVEAVLDAVVSARDAMPKAKQAGFLLGLMRGEGYPALVAAVLETAAERIDDDEVTNFRDVASDFLVKVAGIVKTKEQFRGFFEEHWGDIVRAGLSATGDNAEVLLGDRQLLGTILGRVATDLARHEDNRLLSAESLFGIVNSVAAAAASSPDQVEELLGPNKRWLSKLIGSVAGTVADDGIRATFTKPGVEELFQDAFAAFAAEPELLVGDSELAGAIVGGVLSELKDAEIFQVRELAAAAVGGALSGIATNPDVLKFEYSELVSSFAGKVAVLVKEKKLSGVQARDIVQSTIESLAENPQLFLDTELDISEVVVGVVSAASDDHPAGLVAGVVLSAVVQEVVRALSRTGRAALKNHPSAELVLQLEELTNAGLVRGQVELGHRLSLAELPPSMGLLVELWAQGKIATIDPENDNFKMVFSEIADQAAA